MALVKQVDKKVRLSLADIIKFQLISTCYIKKITITESDYDCLTLLGLNGEVEIPDFCNAACNIVKRDREPNIKISKEIFKSPQTVRNVLSKLEKHGLLIKKGKSKKLMGLNPDLNVQTSGNILLNYKIFYFES